MVKETGEGTARFLHSVVKGEVDAREAQSKGAKRARDQVASVPASAEICQWTATTLVPPTQIGRAHV